MLDHFTDQVNKKKVRGEIIMTGKRFSTFPLTRTTGIMQFRDPALTTSRKAFRYAFGCSAGFSRASQEHM